jgi:hypothetical protein
MGMALYTTFYLVSKDAVDNIIFYNFFTGTCAQKSIVQS